MKTIFIFICFFTFQKLALATNVLNNCFEKNSASFFRNELDAVSQEKFTQILLYDKLNQVVGLIAAELVREEESSLAIKKVNFHWLQLCSSLEVDVFYYMEEENGSNLFQWPNITPLVITQDEGMILLSTSLVSKENTISLFRASFKAYDVFDVEQDLKDPADFVEDWGYPKGIGEFYFYLPSKREQ